MSLGLKKAKRRSDVLGEGRFPLGPGFVAT